MARWRRLSLRRHEVPAPASYRVPEVRRMSVIIVTRYREARAGRRDSMGITASISVLRPARRSWPRRRAPSLFRAKVGGTAGGGIMLLSRLGNGGRRWMGAFP